MVLCQDKIMTTGGEGGWLPPTVAIYGLICGPTKTTARSWEAVYERQHPPGFRWLHESFRTNWRMLEVQGVIGRIQLRRMAAWHAARLINAQRIWEVASRAPGFAGA